MSTAKIKVSNLPPAPEPTKAVRIGSSFHQIPGRSDLRNPEKQVKAENEIIFEVRDENDPSLGITVTTNKYYFARARRAAVDAFDTWLNVWDISASFYFKEDDAKDVSESTLLEVTCKLFKNLGIGGHVEGRVDIVDPIMLHDTFWVSKRTNHLEHKNRRRIPDRIPIGKHVFE